MCKKISSLTLFVQEIFKIDEEKFAIKLHHEIGFRPSEILKRRKEFSISKDKVYRVCKRLRVGDLVDNRYIEAVEAVQLVQLRK